jgi:hypothetical protein
MASIPTQKEFLAATRKSQEAMIAAIRTWFETVRTAAPKLTSVYERLPKLPPVSVPFADRLPTPEEAVDNAYHLAEQLLANQRRFAEELVKVTAPLRPGYKESSLETPTRGAWHKAVAGGEPKRVPVSEPKPVAVSEPKPVAVSEPKPVAVSEPKPVAVSEPKPVAVSEPKPVAVSEPKPVAVPEPKTTTAGTTTPKSTPAASARKSAAAPAPKSAGARTSATRIAPKPTAPKPAPKSTEAS